MIFIQDSKENSKNCDKILFILQIYIDMYVFIYNF